MYILFSALHLKKEMIFPWRVKSKFQYKLRYQFLSNNQVSLFVLPTATFQIAFTSNSI